MTTGGDTTISASRVQAGTEEKKADLNIDAGGDLVIASGKDMVAHDDREKSKGFLSKGSISTQSHNETTVGSELGASGNVNLNAGNNAVIAGSKVTAGEAITVEGDSVSVIGARENHARESESKQSGLFVGSGGGFLSLWGKEKSEREGTSTVNVGSELSAGTDVNIKARASDVNIVGSRVEASQDIALDAARDVNVMPGAESASSREKEERSGFGIQVSSGNGSASIGIGYGKSKDEIKQGAETNAGSSLDAGRDIRINAGRDANLQAAQIGADRDVAIAAERDVNLLSAQDVTNYEHVHEELFAGITAQVSTGLVSAGKSIGDAAEKIGKVSDGYSAANAGFAGLKAYDAIEDLSKMANGTGNIASASLTVGFDYSRSKETAESSTPVVTTIRGGRSVSIDAVSGDLNSSGAQVLAGYDAEGNVIASDDDKAGDITLHAGNDINLHSAQATSSASSSSKSAGAGIGVSAGLTLAGPQLGLTGNVHAGMSKSNSEGTTQVNTHVLGTGDIKLESGRDTNLKGAVVSGETVTADVGRDLNIVSVPDTGEASSKSASFGMSIGGALGGVPVITGVSPGGGTGSGETNWIPEQSGLISSGKMDVTVGGNTHLGAGKIISESGDLTLDTGTLTHENFSGSQNYEGFDVQADIDLTPRNEAGEKQQQPGDTSQPRTSAEGSYQLDDTRQTVRATVGPGEITIRDKEKQTALEAEGKTEDLTALNRDPNKAYEITKDKHVDVEFYLSDTSVKKALEAGKTVADIIVDALGRMASDGKLGQQDYASAVQLARYKDDPNVIAQLNECGQRQGFNRFNPFDWLVTPAYAQGACLIKTPEGTFTISPFGARTCQATFGALTSSAGMIGLAAGAILLATTTSAGGGKIDETRRMDDGTVVHLTGNGADLSRKADLVMADGSRASLDFMLDPNTGELILTGGTINGKPMARPSLQNVIYSMQSGGMKNIVLSENAGMGHNGGPPLDDDRTGNNGNNQNPNGVPPAAVSVLQHIQQTGQKPNGYVGDRTFANDGRGGGQVLPRQDSQGNPITYKEYDINPYTRGVNRGAERIVIGSDGNAYYTSDHYNTFTKMWP
nr:hemagglutinin repeat-containing protein [Paramesorhizobium deserti]